MTKLTLSLSSVDLSAHGLEFSVDPADFAAIALEGIMTYGIRRWFQDNINSAAHTFKLAAKEAKDKGETFNDGKPFDVQAAFQARLEQARSGVLSAPRAKSGLAGLSALEETLYAVAIESKSAPAFKPILVAWGLSKGLGTLERKQAILLAVSALPITARTALHKAAESRLALAESLSGLDL